MYRYGRCYANPQPTPSNERRAPSTRRRSLTSRKQIAVSFQPLAFSCRRAAGRARCAPSNGTEANRESKDLGLPFDIRNSSFRTFPLLPSFPPVPMVFVPSGACSWPLRGAGVVRLRPAHKMEQNEPSFCSSREVPIRSSVGTYTADRATE